MYVEGRTGHAVSILRVSAGMQNCCIHCSTSHLSGVANLVPALCDRSHVW